MAVNQFFDRERVNTLPTIGLKAGTRYDLNVGGNKFKTFVVSDGLQLIMESGAEFIEKDTVVELRAISSKEIWSIQQGYYKGIRLHGYYDKGDTPAPIDYFLSSTSEDDNGGSVFKIGNVKFKHNFIEKINVKYFGAKGDGVTNNTGFIQNAIDSLNKGVIYIPTGTFIVTSLRLKSNIEITGDGKGRSIIKRDPTIDVPYWNNTPSLKRLSNIFTNWRYEGSWAENISINNITIDGSLDEVDLSNTSNMAPAWANIELCLVTNVNIYNIESKNSIGDGFRANGCDNIILNESLFYNNGYYVDGFSKNAVSFRGREYIDQTAQTILVAGSVIMTNCKVDKCVDEALIVYRMGNCIVSNNTFKNVGEYFLEFYGDNAGEDSDTKLVISNNVMENNGSVAMSFGDSNFTVNVLVSNNIFKNIGKYTERPVQQSNPSFIRSIYSKTNLIVKDNIFESDSIRIGNGFIVSGKIVLDSNIIKLSADNRVQSTLVSLTNIEKAIIKNNSISSSYDSIVIYIRNETIDIDVVEVSGNNITTNSTIAPGNSGVVQISKPTAATNVYKNIAIINNIINHLNGNGVNISSGSFTNLSILGNIINASYRGVNINSAVVVTKFVYNNNSVTETITTPIAIPYIKGNTNNLRKYGNTSQRPDLSLLEVGDSYIDSTLSNKVIYKLNNTTWIDSSGATV